MKKNIMLSGDQSREVDSRAINEYGMLGIVLMENAGRGVVDYLRSWQIQGKIVICCGKGNNAGDGFVIARHLDNHHYSVQVLLFSNPQELKGDAKINYDILLKSDIPITIVNETNFENTINHTLSKANWIIDAIFGTGLQGLVRSPYDKVIQAINETDATVVAIDIPSGLDSDTGKSLGVAVKADYTVTFVAYKKGFSHPQAAQFLGTIQVVDIGVPRKLIQNLLDDERI